MTRYVKIKATYFFLLTSGSSRCLVFERIFSNTHYLHNRYNQKCGIGWWIRILNFKHDMLCEIQGSTSSFFFFRVLQMFCIWQNIIKLSLLSWLMLLEMGNRMIDKDFLFQMWHAMWSSRLHIFLLLTSRSFRCHVFERIFSNHHYPNDKYDYKWGIGW